MRAMSKRRIGRCGNSGDRRSMTTEEVLNVAENQFRSGRADQAESICRQILAQVPEHVGAINLLGMSLAEQRRLDEAIAAFERLAALRPNLADVHANLALALPAGGAIDRGGGGR